MNLITVKGLVIKTVDIRESDRLITIFTEEMGVVTAMAKGARSLKSRQMSSTMQFCYSSFVLYRRDDNYWVREAELIESFFDIRRSIEGLALAGYIVEVLADVAVAEADKDLLRLSLNSLYAISSGKYQLNKIKAAFEIRTAAILGFMPDVIGCVDCAEKNGDFYFDIMGGFIRCFKCQQEMIRQHQDISEPHESTVISILSDGAKAALGYSIYCPIEKIFSFNISDEDMELFSRATEEYLLNQLERSFKTLEFYKEIIR